jgi:Flp pilus assembly protein TadG
MFGLQSGSALWRLKDAAMRLASERRGVAAVEFALIAPLLLSMYFVTLEVAQGIETNKKVARVGSMVADLITQQQTIDTAALKAIMQIGGSVIQPYNRTQPKIFITAIEITPDPNSRVRVAWSRKMVEGEFSSYKTKDETTEVPDALNVKGSFLIRVESELSYKPLIIWTAGQKETFGLLGAFDGIEMKEVYYLRPRMSSSIVCSDC